LNAEKKQYKKSIPVKKETEKINLSQGLSIIIDNDSTNTYILSENSDTVDEVTVVPTTLKGDPNSNALLDANSNVRVLKPFSINDFNKIRPYPVKQKNSTGLKQIPIPRHLINYN
jgi:hypothetical protein